MSSIYKYGGIGGVAGAVLGGILGGIPGAVALGQLGAGAGLQVGKWTFGADLTGRVVNQVVDKTIRTIDTAEKFFFAVAVPTGIYWKSSQSTQENCAVSRQGWDCEFLKGINVVLMLYSAGTMIYLASKTTERLVASETKANIPEEASLVVEDPSKENPESKENIFSRTLAASSKKKCKSYGC